MPAKSNNTGGVGGKRSGAGRERKPIADNGSLLLRNSVTRDQMCVFLTRYCDKFLASYYELMKSRRQLLSDYELMRETLCDTFALDTEICKDQRELAVVAEYKRVHVKKNTADVQSQTEYAAETERLERRYTAALEQSNTLKAVKEKRQHKSKEIQAFAALLHSQPPVVTERRERLWITLLDTATAMADETMVFRLNRNREQSIRKSPADWVQPDFFSVLQVCEHSKRKNQKIIEG